MSCTPLFKAANQSGLPNQSSFSVSNATASKTGSQFKYLGSMFVANGQGTEEIRSRINLARSAVSRLQSLLWSRREISLRTKGRVYQAVVRSILLYGCETWWVRVADQRMLEVFDNDSIRRILRASRRRLCAIRGAASPPLPYKQSSTARAKKAPMVWKCRKTPGR